MILATINESQKKVVLRNANATEEIKTLPEFAFCNDRKTYLHFNSEKDLMSLIKKIESICGEEISVCSRLLNLIS